MEINSIMQGIIQKKSTTPYPEFVDGLKHIWISKKIVIQA